MLLQYGDAVRISFVVVITVLGIKIYSRELGTDAGEVLSFQSSLGSSGSCRFRWSKLDTVWCSLLCRITVALIDEQTLNSEPKNSSIVTCCCMHLSA